MNKIIFIVPYFGIFPPYFNEWMYSAGFLAEQSVDFLLVTDNSINSAIPPNIRLLNMTFQDFRKKVQKKFDFHIALDTPYKICDFKPALGYIFENEILPYQFWGNCDIDQVWGDVKGFITEDILNSYDRIQSLGHFTLYRNDNRINLLFQQPGSPYDYRKVYSSPLYYSFDEHEGMMCIVAQNHVSNYLKMNYADLWEIYSRIQLYRAANYRYQIVYWKEGKIFRSYVAENGKAETEEYMYAHFQKKAPKGLTCWKERVPRAFLIHKDQFVEFDPDVLDSEKIKELSDFISEKQDKKEERKYIWSKIKRFIAIPMQSKIIWMTQRKVRRKMERNREYFGANVSDY